MVVLIKSSAGRPAIRELLRRTWATLSYVNKAQFRSIFVIGKANKNQQLIIDEEAKRYGDILQLNVSDDYRFVKVKFSCLNLKLLIKNHHCESEVKSKSYLGFKRKYSALLF